MYIVISISYLLRCIILATPSNALCPGFITASMMMPSEVVFSLVLLGTFKYHFVELIAATVIFDCVRETHTKCDWFVMWEVDFDRSKIELWFMITLNALLMIGSISC